MPNAVPRVPFRELRGNLDTLLADCREEGARLVLIDPPLRTVDYRAPEFRVRREILRQFAVDESIPLVAVPEMIDAPTDELFGDSVHPNTEGHRRLADALQRVLADERLLPPFDAEPSRTP